MNLHDLSHVLVGDERAVSPVIGVILMVAITVILAAVLGTFVLGLGEQKPSQAPQASFEYDLSNGDQNLTITHDSGDAITSSRIDVQASVAIDDATGDGQPTDTKTIAWDDLAETSGSSYEITAGNSTEIGTADASTDFTGETVRIIWHAPESSETATISKLNG